MQIRPLEYSASLISRDVSAFLPNNVKLIMILILLQEISDLYYQLNGEGGLTGHLVRWVVYKDHQRFVFARTRRKRWETEHIFIHCKNIDLQISKISGFFGKMRCGLVLTLKKLYLEFQVSSSKISMLVSRLLLGHCPTSRIIWPMFTL